MTEIGGVRARYVRDSLWEMINDALTQLDWFKDDRPHLPVSFVDEEPNWDEEIALNTLALADEDKLFTEWELGSNFVEDSWAFVLDFYGEDRSIAIHMVNDLAAILQGKMASIGRGEPNFMVKDYGNNGEDLFRVEIENVAVDRARNWTKGWQKNWYFVSFDVVDHYGDENDD